MKKYKIDGIKELMSEDEVNEMYVCNYCSDTLIEYGEIRKDWYLTETCYGDYCCEKNECVWEYFGDHEGIYGNEQIAECDSDMQSAEYDEQQELLRKGQQ